MSVKITTLHLKNDPTTNVYPNVKMENIPLDVTIAQGGANLATSGTIYDFVKANYLSLDGGTMKGNIMTGGFASPEEAVLGNGLDVSDLSSQSEPVTHYGGGYIRQDDNEDSSIKYEYDFPKKSGTFITDNWDGFSEYAKKEDLGDIWSVVSGQDFTIREQKSYKIGNIIFTKINGYTDDTGLTANALFLKCDDNFLPTLSQLFTIYNGSVQVVGEMRFNGYISTYSVIGANRTSVQFEFFYIPKED